MATFPISNHGQLVNAEDNSNRKEKGSLFNRYLSYVDSQEDQYIFWYMTAIIAIPCVLMPLSFIVMNMYTSIMVYYIGFAMTLFFVNVIAHVAGLKARVYLPVLHITAILMILIPAVAYLISIL